MVRGPSAGHLQRYLPLMLAIACGTAALAQPASSSPAAATAHRDTVVSAFVWNAVSDPVPNVVVALRNLGNARIERTMTSDTDGHVIMRGMESGTYVLEIVDARGVVIATGQTFTIDIGESVATFVRLPAKSPWYSGLFNNVGAISVATAAALGATAVGTTGQPQSPGR